MHRTAAYLPPDRSTRSGRTPFFGGSSLNRVGSVLCRSYRAALSASDDRSPACMTSTSSSRRSASTSPGASSGRASTPRADASTCASTSAAALASLPGVRAHRLRGPRREREDLAPPRLLPARGLPQRGGHRAPRPARGAGQTPSSTSPPSPPSDVIDIASPEEPPVEQASRMVVLEAQSGVPGRLPRQTKHRLKGTKRTRRQQATHESSPISSARGWRAP